MAHVVIQENFRPEGEITFNQDSILAIPNYPP
jgi:hypothetical protein